MTGCHNLTDSMLKHIPGVKYLKVVDSPFITGSGLHNLGKLESLELPECAALRDEYLADLTSLKRLIVPSTCISDKALKSLNGLVSLDISDNQNISDESLTYLKGIRTLSLADTRITNDGLDSIAGVKSLDLCFCDAISDEGMQYLKGIEGIRMTGCTLVNGSGFDHLWGIKWMTFNGCSGVDDNLLKNIHDKLSCLEFLDLSYCQMWSDDGCKYLNGIPNLKLDYCTQLTDKGMKELIPRFISLSIKGIHVGNDEIKHLVETLKKPVDKKWKKVCAGRCW
jgi:Leucine-rich repeat (LRR) protein